jgi:hypothetical protein
MKTAKIGTNKGKKTMHPLRLALCMLILLISSHVLHAQEDGSFPIPDPLFEAESPGLAQVRAWSMDKWMAVRKTNHPLYHNALGPARFRSYVYFCRRHELNVNMPILNEMALKNLSEIIVAHFEETEWSKFGAMDKADVRRFIGDLGQDIYAFEYATAIAERREAQDRLEMTTQAYCASISKENQDNYIALRATAKRQLGR